MKYEHIHKELIEWREEGIITPEQFDILEQKYSPKEQKITRFYTKITRKKLMTLFMSIIVILGSFAWIGEFLKDTSIVAEQILNDFVTIGGLTLLVAIILYFGDYLADRNLNVIKFIGKLTTVSGGMLITFIVFYTDFKISSRLGIKILGDDWALFLLISVIILVFITYKIKEKSLLAYLIILLYIWFISEGKIRTGSYLGNWLGMTLPMRLFLFSLIFVGLGYLHKNKTLEKFKWFKDYKFFANTYYVFGYSVMFISAFVASLGKWIPNPLLPIRLEALVYLLISFAITIYITYIYGLLKNNVFFLKLGLLFFIILVFGNLYRVFENKLNSPLFYIFIVITSILVAIVTEYTLTHRKELTKELLKEYKG